jgi:hypothetical protein
METETYHPVYEDRAFHPTALPCQPLRALLSGMYREAGAIHVGGIE